MSPNREQIEPREWRLHSIFQKEVKVWTVSFLSSFSPRHPSEVADTLSLQEKKKDGVETIGAETRTSSSTMHSPVVPSPRFFHLFFFRSLNFLLCAPMQSPLTHPDLGFPIPLDWGKPSVSYLESLQLPETCGALLASWKHSLEKGAWCWLLYILVLLTFKLSMPTAPQHWIERLDHFTVSQLG